MTISESAARKFDQGLGRREPVLDYERLDLIAEQRKDEFAAAEPFPHTAIDDFLPGDIAEEALAEFPTPALSE